MIAPLTVYTLPDCVQCRLTEQALVNAGVPYTAVDLASDEVAVDYVQQLGHTTTPIVTVGAASWAGYRPDKIRAVVSARAAAAYAVPVDPMDGLGCDSCQ
jgi:glutaredoxin-like protein NrdH